MDWYVVVKTINCHRYRYRQKTWREGRRVRTRSEYLGRADGTPNPKDSSGSKTLTLPFPTAPGGSQLAFDPSVTKRAIEGLVERDTLSENWEHAWSAARRGKNLVEKDPRISRLLATLEVMVTDETEGAYYSPNLDIVNVPPEKCFRHRKGQTATQAYHVVLFHELVHWTMDKRRTGRDVSDYAREELVAELGAIMLMDHFSLQVGNLDRHAKYFQTWLSRAGSRDAALAHAAREAERAVKYIVEHGTVH
jgi:antirestriction protein ArdC